MPPSQGKLSGAVIVPLELSAQLLADDEELPSVGAENGRRGAELAAGDPNRSGERRKETAEDRRFAGHRPDVRAASDRHLKDKILAIRRPTATTEVDRTVD